jgi:cytochrome c6
MAGVRVNLFRGTALVVLAGVALWSTPAAADAAATYKTKCAVCHGADGKGDSPAGKSMGAHDFHSPEVAKQSDADLGAIVAKGKKRMPGYEKSLNPDEIKNLIAYIRQLK